ncbi:MAG: NADH-quinone oxidoreductase subunit NuoB [Pseudomonadota bacterium]|nr:NADH-quinone oxidoreductase subunit NuoB [Pseudomonadota bacterium]
MLKLLIKMIKTGIITEPEPTVAPSEYPISRGLRGSLAIRQLDAGSCNACELEIQALNNSFYSIERLGVHFVAAPRHADALLVTGPVSRHMHAALIRTYEAMPQPKWVIACGDCAVDGGEWSCSYASCGGVPTVLPVDIMISGCPPTPTALLDTIRQLT